MDHSSSHSTTQGTAEVPPKGAAGAGNRRGRPKKAKAAQGRRPGGGDGGPKGPKREHKSTQKGPKGKQKGNLGVCSGPMFMHFLFGKQKVQKHWAGLTPRQTTRGQKGAPGGRGRGTKRGRRTHGPTEGSRGGRGRRRTCAWGSTRVARLLPARRHWPFGFRSRAFDNNPRWIATLLIHLPGGLSA